jgi:hypothetical protein
MPIKLDCTYCKKSKSAFDEIFKASVFEEIDVDEDRPPDVIEHPFELFACSNCKGLFKRDGSTIINGEEHHTGFSFSWYRSRHVFDSIDKIDEYRDSISKSSNGDFRSRAISAIECAECGFYAEGMMALRAAFEVLVIDGKDERKVMTVRFPDNIAAFGTDRGFGQTYTDNANALVNAGHGAIHRDWKPKRAEFREVLKLLGSICREVNNWEETQKVDAETDAARSSLAGAIPPARRR